jgi:hypothetical protein
MEKLNVRFIDCRAYQYVVPKVGDSSRTGDYAGANPVVLTILYYISV